MDESYVIAVLCDGFSVYGSQDSFYEALVGSNTMKFDASSNVTTPGRSGDGFFSPSKNRRVSAVLSFVRLNPFVNPKTILESVPTIWMNPWAAHPFRASLSMAQKMVPDLSTGTFQEEQPHRTLPDALGLDPGWPDPEDLKF